MKWFLQVLNISHRLFLGSYFVNTINKSSQCKFRVYTCILKVHAKTLPNSECQEERVAKVFDVRESPPLFQCKIFTFQSFSLKLLPAFYLLFSDHFVFSCM